MQKEKEVEAFRAGYKKAFERAAEETESYAKESKQFGNQVIFNGFTNLAAFFRSMAK